MNKLLTTQELNSLQAESILKKIKSTFKDAEKVVVYDAKKAAVRSDHKYWSFEEEEEEDRWRRKIARQKKSLNCGFFSDKSQPYIPVGKVYLDPGELILNSMSEFLAKNTTFKSKQVKEKDEDTKISTKNLAIKPARLSVIKRRFVIGQPTPGLLPLKERIREVRAMKKCVYAKQSFGIVISDENSKEMKESENFNEGSYPTKSFDHQHNANETSSGNASDRHHHSRHKSSLHSKSERLVTSEQRLGALEPEWMKKVRLTKLKENLKAINSLFCAMFNLPTKQVKKQKYLSGKEVMSLLRSDVSLDTFGRPMGWKPIHQSSLDDDTLRDSSDGGFSDSNFDFPFRPEKSKLLTAFQESKFIKQTIKKKKKQEVLPPLETPSKLETWDELKGVEKKNLKRPESHQRPSARNRSTNRRRLAIMRIASENVIPWMTVSSTESFIRQKKAINFLEETPLQSAEEGLNKICEDFWEVRNRLEKDMETECRNQRRHQFDDIINKYNTMVVGHRVSRCLERMRDIAKIEKMRRIESTLEPCQWFLELRVKVHRELNHTENNDVVRAVEKIERFQYEDGSTMPLAKEKLCILVMSMPIYALLPDPMMDAMVVIIEQVLHAPVELLLCWLAARRLEKTSKLFQVSSNNDS